MNLRGLLKHRNAIYGICAVWIVCFHVSLSVHFPTNSYTLSRLITHTLKQSDATVNGVLRGISQFLSCGNLGVDIFMLLSGLCLYLSFERRYGDGKIEFLSYLKKRVVRVAVPYLVISFPYWLWIGFVRAHHGVFNFGRFFRNYSSITFWFGESRKAWFVFAIMLFYLLFPLFYKLIRKSSVFGLVLLAAVYAGGYFICKSPADNIAIAVSRLPSFIIGIIAGKNIDKIDLGRLPEAVRGLVVFGAFGLLMLGTAFFPVHKVVSKNHLPDYFVWYAYSLLAVCFIIVFMWICGKAKRFYFENALNFLGGLSLEIYLVHTLTLGVLTFYKVNKSFGVWLFPLLIAWGIIGGFLFSKLVNLIMSPFDKKPAPPRRSQPSGGERPRPSYDSRGGKPYRAPSGGKTQLKHLRK